MGDNKENNEENANDDQQTDKVVTPTKYRDNNASVQDTYEEYEIDEKGTQCDIGKPSVATICTQTIKCVAEKITQTSPELLNSFLPGLNNGLQIPQENLGNVYPGNGFGRPQGNPIDGYQNNGLQGSYENQNYNRNRSNGFPNYNLQRQPWNPNYNQNPGNGYSINRGYHRGGGASRRRFQERRWNNNNWNYNRQWDC